MEESWSELVRTCGRFCFSAVFVRMLMCITRVSHGTHETQINHVIKIGVCVIPLLQFEFSLYWTKVIRTHKTRYRGHSKYVRSFLGRSYFYKMKVFKNFLRWGAPHPHTPLAGAAPQTPRFCGDIESLMGNKPVYKIKKQISFLKTLITWDVCTLFLLFFYEYV